MMNSFMKGILSRTLSTEIGFQMYLKSIENGRPEERDDNIRRIKEFMADNDIEFRADYCNEGFIR